MDHRLEQLLQTKSFADLTAEEKYHVTASIGEAEYNRMYKVLKGNRSVRHKMPVASPELKNRLVGAFREQHGGKTPAKKHGVVRLLRYRVPAWQAAAVIALLLGMHFWLQPVPQVVEKTDTVYVHTTDTIYKEIQPQTLVNRTPERSSSERINVKPSSSRPVAREKEPILLAAADSALRQMEFAQVPDTFAMPAALPRGQSATQSAELWDLLEVVY